MHGAFRAIVSSLLCCGVVGGCRKKVEAPREGVALQQRAPEVEVGEPEVVGSLDKDLVRRVEHRHRDELLQCYEAELEHDASLSGAVELKFVIAGTGRVPNARVLSSELGNLAVEQCITERVLEWQFPEPMDGVVLVTYTFKFVSD